MSGAGNVFTDGKAYERMMGRWTRLVGKAFFEWLDVPEGLKWLDVGCGNGASTEELIARCAPAAVEAIDPSEQQLAYARTRSGAGMANFRTGDAQALPFDDDSFDAAIMALVIAFVPDPAKGVAEMARVVRPGGWVAAYMWDIPAGGAPLQPLHDALQSLGINAPRPTSSAASTEDALRELWEGAGLVSIGTRTLRIKVAYSDFDDFWDSNVVPIGPQGKLLQDMPPQVKEQLRERLREQLPVAPDGRITYEAFCNAVTGRMPQR
jgi:ubiquinone/menaquinone biosynthesis C-methylase UbiE